MSYEDEDQGNEFANGANNRFAGLDVLYKEGGEPRRAPSNVVESMLHLIDFFDGVDGSHAARKALERIPTTVELAREFYALKQAKEHADEVAKELGRRYDHMRLAVMPERFEAEGLKNIKVDGVGRVGLRGDMHAAILPGMKEKAFEWLDDTGRGALVQRTVNPQSLKASLKKVLEGGEEEIPDTIFRVSPFTMATITRV